MSARWIAIVSMLTVGCVARVDLGEPRGAGAVRILEAGTTEDLLAVHPCGPDDVWIAGAHGTVLRVRDSIVSAVPTPTRFDLRAIVCERADRVWAAGDRTTLLSWDGAWTEWHGGPVDISDEPLDYIELTLHQGDVWLLPEGTAYDDGFMALALRFDGTAWSSTTRVMEHAGGTTLVAGGAGLFVFHDDEHFDAWNGTAWERRLVPLSDASSYDLAAAAVAEDVVHLVGTDADGDAVILRAGDTWDTVARDTFDPDQRPSTIVRLSDRSIVGTSGGDLFAVDDAGAVSRIAETRRAIHALTATSTDVWAVGAEGLIAVVPIATE